MTTKTQEQINRLVVNRDNALNAIRAKGVSVPLTATTDDIPTLISQIEGSVGLLPANYVLISNDSGQISVSEITSEELKSLSKISGSIEERLQETIPQSQKGKSNGVVPLNDVAQIDSKYLPSYVDDVLEYNTRFDFPANGEKGKIYVTIDTGLAYRWSGTTYIEIFKNSDTTYKLSKNGSKITLTGSDGSVTNVEDTDTQYSVFSGIGLLAQPGLVPARVDQIPSQVSYLDDTGSWTTPIPNVLPRIISINNVHEISFPTKTGTLALVSDLADYLKSSETAVAANKLANKHTINGVVFDGTQDIVIADDTKLPKGATAESAKKLTKSLNINGITFDGSQSVTINTSDDTKLSVSGGSLNGDLTGQLISATRLRTTSATAQTSAATRICVLDGSGYVNTRTTSQILSDIGGATASSVNDLDTQLGNFITTLKNSSY